MSTENTPSTNNDPKNSSIRIAAQGIQAVQVGNLEDGKRLINQALADSSFTGTYRANAYVWLAETTTNTQTKIDHHTKALEYDPGNKAIQEHLDRLKKELQGEKPPSLPGMIPPPTLPEQIALYGEPTAAQGFQYTVGILNGPNGKGSGFFASQDGIVATTRFAVGSNRYVDVELEPGKKVYGQVVRSFPKYDLALINLDMPMQKLLSGDTDELKPGTALIIPEHAGPTHQTLYPITNTQPKKFWFPTTLSSISDAGGAPIFTAQNNLVGMMTRNTLHHQTDAVYGLHIDLISQAISHYRQELKARHPLGGGTYCHQCGFFSTIQVPQAFYCEHCGSILHGAEEVVRFPRPNTAAVYDETKNPCPNCGSRVGYHRNKCLRCAYEIN